MKEVFFKLKKRQKFGILFMLLYSIVNSMFFSENIGLISIAILVFYLIINIRSINAYKLSFFISLILVCLSIVLYILDTGEALSIPIKKFSEWTYLFLLVGVLQLVLPG